jgi:hypothetical protein
MNRIVMALIAAASLTACGAGATNDDEFSDANEVGIDETGNVSDEELGTIEGELVTAAYDIEDDQKAKIDAHRASLGKRWLARRACLNTVARGWAKKMARNRTLSHNPYLTTNINKYCKSTFGPWVYAGENVGMGPDSATLWMAFLGSYPHRANIEDNNYGSIGLGAYRDAYGTVWLTQVFAKF